MADLSNNEVEDFMVDHDLTGEEQKKELAEINKESNEDYDNDVDKELRQPQGGKKKVSKKKKVTKKKKVSKKKNTAKKKKATKKKKAAKKKKATKKKKAAKKK